MKDKKHIKSFGEFNENLNISDVMNSILIDLEKIKNDHIEVRSEASYDKYNKLRQFEYNTEYIKARMDGGILALDKAIDVVKRYCS